MDNTDGSLQRIAVLEERVTQLRMELAEFRMLNRQDSKDIREGMEKLLLKFSEISGGKKVIWALSAFVGSLITIFIAWLALPHGIPAPTK